MIKCPNPECGHDNVDGTQFCEVCGEELAQGTGASAASPVAATATGDASTGVASAGAASADMVRCPACDNMNPADNAICEVCGTELQPAGSTPGVDTTASATGTSAGVPVPLNATVTTTPVDTTTSSASAPVSTPAPITPVASPVDPLATGTATPPLGGTLPDVSADAGNVTTNSIDAPIALSGAAPDVATTTSGAGMPVVATGDTTGSVTPFDAGLTGAGVATADPAATPTGDDLGVLDTPLADPVSDPVMPDPMVSTVATTPITTAPLVGAAPAATTGAGNLQPGAVKLTVEQGMTIGKQFVLGDPELLVGREDEEEQNFPDIDLSDQDEGFVHRKHATLRFENGNLTVTHLGGANKTRLNNRPLPDNEPQAVNIGDKISFGKVVMRVGTV